MCTACTTSKGFETYVDVVTDRVDSMMLQDWLALILASLVVAFAVFSEMRDCMLCEIALRDISQKRTVQCTNQVSRRPRDACSTAWRCRFLTARRSQRGHAVAEK